MRSFLGFVVFTAALIALLAAFLVPPLVAPLVASAVRAASPFGDRPLDVQVEVDALGLLRGIVSEIRISGSDLEAGRVTIGSLELTVRNVEIGGDHEFADVDGSLDAVVVSRATTTSIRVPSVLLSGPSMGVIASASLDAGEALILVTESLADAGVEGRVIELVDGGVAIEVSGQRIEVPLIALGGAVVVPVFGTSPVPVLEPGPDDPWRITAVTVDAMGAVIEASVDAAALFAT